MHYQDICMEGKENPAYQDSDCVFHSNVTDGMCKYAELAMSNMVTFSLYVLCAVAALVSDSMIICCCPPSDAPWTIDGRKLDEKTVDSKLDEKTVDSIVPEPTKVVVSVAPDSNSEA